jgi:hypothetical protein
MWTLGHVAVQVVKVTWVDLELFVDVDPETCCSLNGKGDMGGFRAIGFQLPMLNSKEAGL